MAFTIYTVSDPSTIGSVLTSMAMFFGQESWVGSALKLALLVSLILILAKGVTRDGLRLDVMLMQLLVVMAIFLPKTTVTVEQFENAAPPRVVDGVPYAIAIPGAMAGAFALYMTSKIETVMSAADDNHISVSGGNNPFMPARMLMAFTVCSSDPMGCMDRNLAETMRLAARYCSGGTMSNTKFAKSASVLEDFANGLTKDGISIRYTKDYPYADGGGSGQQASCSEIATYLKGQSAQLSQGNPIMFGDVLKDIANNADIKSYKEVDRNANPDGPSWAESLATMNKVTDNIGKVDTLAMVNVLTYSIADSLSYDAVAPIDQTISIKRDSGLFEWAKSEANSSMLVSTTAPKFMDILFFIFIASTPIVMFMVAANPSSGLKVAASYIVFGLWTQSWIPMMAIITSWYQTEIQNFPAPYKGVVSAEYMANLMRHVNTSTIAAANMLQSAPYMMFAIMTGSMMAMSNMIAQAAPSGGSGAGEIPGAGSSGGGGKAGGVLGAPTQGPGAGPSGAAQLAAMSGASGALGGGLSSSGSAFAGGAGVAAALGGAIPSFDSQSGAQIASAAAATKSSEASAQATQASEQGWSRLLSLGKSGSLGVSSASFAQAASTSGYTVADTFSTGTKDAKTAGAAFGVSHQTNQASSLRAEGTAAVNVGALLGAIGSVLKGKSADGKPSTAEGVAQAASRANLSKMHAEAEKAYASGDSAKGDGIMDKFGKAASAHDAKYSSGSNSILGQVGDVLSKAVKLQASATAAVASGDTQAANLSATNGGSHESTLARGRQITSSTGQQSQSGTRGERTAAFNKTASEIDSSTEGVKTAIQTAQSARDAQALTNTATTSSGVGARTSMDGATFVAAWGNKNGGSGNQQSAMDKVIASVAPTLGAGAGEFKQQMEGQYQKLLSEGKGSTMSPDQIAGAAALKTINGMMQSQDSGKMSSGVAALARMAENAGIDSGLNAGALTKAAELNSEVAKNISARNAELAPQISQLKNDVDVKPENTAALSNNVAGQIDQSARRAESGLATAGNGNPAATGLALGQAMVEAKKPDIVPASDPSSYSDQHARAVKNQDNIPSSGDAGPYVSGQESTITSVPLQKSGSPNNHSPQNDSPLTGATNLGNSTSSEVVKSINAVTDSPGTGAPAQTSTAPSGTGAGIPTLGTSSNSSSTVQAGGNGGGVAPLPSHQPNGKPSDQGKTLGTSNSPGGKPPLQGRK